MVISKVSALKNNFPHAGKIDWIGLRPSSSNTINEVETAELLQGHGLVGDKAGQCIGGKRQVTLIQAEYLPVIASFLNLETVHPELLRRNIVVSGINLGILKGSKLKLNSAVIEITGNCAPCAKMEEVLGPGGFNAVLNHGGMNAIVIRGGVIGVGDEILVTTEQPMQPRLL